MNGSAVLFAVLLTVPIAWSESAPGVDEHLGTSLPGRLRAVDHAGTTWRLEELLGERATLLVPAYYSCPQLCGLNLHGLARGMAELGDLAGGEGIALLAVSFDPRDDATAAQERRDGLMAATSSPAWTFAVLDAADRDTFLDAIGWRVAQDPITGEYAHPAGAVVLTGDGRIARYLHGLEPRSEDLRLALVEAGEGTIGDAVDGFMLLCYRYDPAERRYGLFVGGFMRLGAILVMLIAGLGLVLLVRRIRRREAAA